MRQLVGILALLLVCLQPVGAADLPGPRLQAGQILRGHFVQERHLAGFNAPLRTEGSFLLAPGKGLIWRAEKPFVITTIIGANGLLQQVDGTETMRLPATRLPFLARLYDMLGGALAGDWQALDADFTVSRGGNGNQWKVSLTPRKSDDIAMPFRSITLEGSRFVDHVTMTKPDGDFDSLTFLDQSLGGGELTASETANLDSLGK